ncbi:uncharacterized protein F4822DRAFT_435577 [Hypoxylon trugodes]|uniref:uncharacterized protein n=1 Tax=Hypoxylon trugodes TaxID=326681 RepID=UPI002199C6F4|nr:uncharacterized protein F4822DRAFT_435577 [Hypoxylon trugodes]KAI1393178.1 hypothetical protein F4822DRAFT_435577 [Hypoxylon trugodes]
MEHNTYGRAKLYDSNNENTIHEHRPAKEEKTLYHVLPDVIRISFEEAVKNIKLEGWEDEWLSSGHFDAEKHGPLAEPKIDFVYNWVNGSEDDFKNIRHSYELDSPLNDREGKWISQHSINRYRDWDELRYSLRSLDVYAKGFINKIQLLVNSVGSGSYGENMRPQRPTWLKDDENTNEHVQVLSHESFFREQEKECLPTFNSLSIESQIFMTPSSTDQLVALSDDMFLGMPHEASDFYSPLFGPVMGFKSDHYNVKHLGGKDQIPSFGEKPFVYYTSYLLNHRFGQRNRHVQAHFTHSVSRTVMEEAMSSFPQPSAKGACERFRGESKYQIYPWYASFHYTIERFREALLWSFIMSRSDENSDGYLDWTERQHILQAVEPGWRQLAVKDSSKPAAQSPDRDRMFYKLPQMLQKAGLQPPNVNINVLWTSLDGPETIRNIKCGDFSVDKCFGDSFASSLSDTTTPNPDFSASNVFSRLSYQRPQCGDCLIKFLLSTQPRGLEPLLPLKATKPRDREVIVKALRKYQHTIVDTDAMKFVMVKDAEQAEMELLERTTRRGKTFGQWCLNDDVMTESAQEVGRVRDVINQVFESLWPGRGRWEKGDDYEESFEEIEDLRDPGLGEDQR